MMPITENELNQVRDYFDERVTLSTKALVERTLTLDGFDTLGRTAMRESNPVTGDTLYVTLSIETQDNLDAKNAGKLEPDVAPSITYPLRPGATSDSVANHLAATFLFHNLPKDVPGILKMLHVIQTEHERDNEYGKSMRLTIGQDTLIASNLTELDADEPGIEIVSGNVRVAFVTLDETGEARVRCTPYDKTEEQEYIVPVVGQ